MRELQSSPHEGADKTMRATTAEPPLTEALPVPLSDGSDSDTSGRGLMQSSHAAPNDEAREVYKVYRRRWFGLVQLVLLNIIVSWDVSRQLRIAWSVTK
jgi:hypothetical protein